MKNEELILTCTKKQVLMQKIHLDPILYTQLLQILSKSCKLAICKFNICSSINILVFLRIEEC